MAGSAVCRDQLLKQQGLMIALWRGADRSVRATTLAFLLCLTAVTAVAEETLLEQAWPRHPQTALQEIGAGVAVVFSPDLSVPGTCDVYAALGFACFQEADWGAVIDGIAVRGDVRTVVLETHGTNGHGLRLQRSKDPRAARSYISIGGLRERLALLGVRYVVLGACNSARLLRPEIHHHLNPRPGDKLFLPPTLGIYGASPDYDEAANPVEILTLASSQVEMTIVAGVEELAPRTREAIELATGRPSSELRFVVSDLMMSMLVRQPAPRLVPGEPTRRLSRKRSTPRESERLFAQMVSTLEAAASETAGMRIAERTH